MHQLKKTTPPTLVSKLGEEKVMVHLQQSIQPMEVSKGDHRVEQYRAPNKVVPYGKVYNFSCRAGK